jgi:hypothetical protein
MTFFDTTARVSDNRVSLWTIFTAPFRMIGNLLVSMAEASSHMEKVRRLGETSDAELAAAGTNRANEIKRIFASSGAM